MPTSRKRANVVLTEDQERVLHGLAATTDETVSSLVRRAIDAALPIYSAMLPSARKAAAHRVTIDFRLFEHVRQLGARGLLDDELSEQVEALGEAIDWCDPVEGGADPTQEGPRPQANPPILTGGSGHPKSLKSNVVPFLVRGV